MEPWGSQKSDAKNNTPKSGQKVVLHQNSGSHFGAFFDQKSMPKMNQNNNESNIGFWLIFG